MSTYTEEVGKKLNGLLEKTYDAEKGFKKASENVDNKALKSYFTLKAKERYDFGHDLKAELKTFNHEIDKGGSLTGDIHRVWMDVKAMLSLDDEESMLEEAIKGEKAAIEEYDDVIGETNLPMSTKSVLTSQKNKIQNGLNNIKTLEDLK